MRYTKLSLAALLASVASILGVLGTDGFAADVAQKAAYRQSPIVAPVLNWTGCYLGANIGTAWGFAEANGLSGSNTAFAGGGQIGCDYQIASFVIGARNMLNGTAGSGNTNWFDTLTARGGFLVQQNVLLYAQGGAAWAESTNSTGWTVGGGIEWMFVPHWSAFIEYNYMDLGTSAAGCSGTCLLNVKSEAQSVLVGLNFRF